MANGKQQTTRIGPVKTAVLLITAMLVMLSGIDKIGAAPLVHNTLATYSTAKGKVIMTKGDVITIRIDEKDWPAEMGDAVKVSFSVDGEVIPVGTWRVNIVKEGGIIEAVPYEVQGKPNIGMDAIIHTQTGKLKAAKEPKPPLKGTDYVSGEKEPRKKSLDEALASYSRTAVPINLGRLGKSLSYESGTIQIYPDKVEMTARGGEGSECCTLKLSDEFFTNFYATVRVRVDTTSHKHYLAGILYGAKSGDVIKTDSIMGVTAYKYGIESWIHVYRRTTKGKPWDTVIGKRTIEYYKQADSIPAPGVLALVKAGRTCRIFWDGEEIGAWEETILSNDHLWLVFTPVAKGETTATFEDIRIYRLQ
jgi:hypothetical protein